MLHSGKDRLWTITVMGVTFAALSVIGLTVFGLPNRESWPYAFVAGLFELGYSYFLVRAYQTGQLSVAYPIARGSSPLLVALGAPVLAGEHLSLPTAAGIALISVGILALALWTNGFSLPTVLAGLATGLCVAGYTVVDGIGVRLAGDNFAYTASRYLVAGSLMPLVLLGIRGRTSFRAPPKEFIKAAAGGLVAITSYGAIIWALQLGAMGPISALRETSVVFAVLLAKFLIKEPVTWRVLAACLCIALGAMLLNA